MGWGFAGGVGAVSEGRGREPGGVASAFGCVDCHPLCVVWIPHLDVVVLGYRAALRWPSVACSPVTVDPWCRNRNPVCVRPLLTAGVGSGEDSPGRTGCTRPRRLGRPSPAATCARTASRTRDTPGCDTRPVGGRLSSRSVAAVGAVPAEPRRRHVATVRHQRESVGRRPPLEPARVVAYRAVAPLDLEAPVRRAALRHHPTMSPRRAPVKRRRRDRRRSAHDVELASLGLLWPFGFSDDGVAGAAATGRVALATSNGYCRASSTMTAACRIAGTTRAPRRPVPSLSHVPLRSPPNPTLPRADCATISGCRLKTVVPGRRRLCASRARRQVRPKL